MSAYSDLVLAHGPVGYWRLGDATGTAVDSSTGGHNGAYNNAPTHPAGLIAGDADKAVTLDGVNQDVSVAGVTSLGVGTDALTIIAWVKCSSTPQSAVRLQNGGGYLVLCWDTTQQKHICSWDGGTGGVPHGVPADGAIHQTVLVWKRNTINGFQTYLDGRLYGARNSADVAIPNIGAALRIGSFGGGSEFFTGDIDEVQIYDKALSPADIRQDYLLGARQFSRGAINDTRADVVLGKPDFAEMAFNSVVANRLNDPAGCVLDTANNYLYVLDKSNNRILAYRWLGLADWVANSRADTPINLIGQPNVNSAAANGDGNIQLFPTVANATNPYLPAPSRGSLRFADTWALSPAEGGSGSAIHVDGSGNVWVFDTANHRVLRFPINQGWADLVIGQADYVHGARNRDGGLTPANNSLYAAWLFPNGALSSGVFVDANNDVWVADSGNCRVLRFPSGTTTADIVIGAADFVTPGIGNVDPPSAGHSSNTPARFGAVSCVFVNAARTKLYVGDTGNHRIEVFTAAAAGAFTTNMSGIPLAHMYTANAAVTTPTSTTIKDTRQNWPTNMYAGCRVTMGAQTKTIVSNTADTLTLDSAFSPDLGDGLTYSMEWGKVEAICRDTVNANAIWVSSVQWVYDGASPPTHGPTGLFLVDDGNGEILGYKAGTLLGDCCGSIGIDASGNIVATSQRNGNEQDVFYFARADAPTTYTRLFVTSGADQNQPNHVDGYGLGPALNGVAVGGDQVLAGEERGRALFWTGLASLVNGQVASGFLTGFRDSFTGADFTWRDPTGCHVNSVVSDKVGHFWVSVNNNGDHASDGSLCCYGGPLVSADVPDFRIALQGVWGSRAGTLATLEGDPISYVNVAGGDFIALAVSDDGTQLWCVHSTGNRVFRILNPLTAPVVDCVLGQPTFNTYLANQGGSPASNTLSAPGAAAIAPNGDLWVADDVLETAGNKRLLRYSAASIAPGATTKYNVAAATVIPNLNGFEPAFAPTGQMVIGYNAYGPAPDIADPIMASFPMTGRFIGVYNDAATMTDATPDDYLDDLGSMWIAADFNTNGDLYATDHNRAHILVYRQPFTTPAGLSASASAIGITLTPQQATVSGIAHTAAASAMSLAVRPGAAISVVISAPPVIRVASYAIHLRSLSPPYGVVAEFPPIGVSYGLNLGREQTADFRISRVDSQYKLIPQPRVGAFFTIERSDGLLPFVGYVVDYDAPPDDPETTFKLMDHVWLLRRAKTKKSGSFSGSTGALVTAAMREINARAQPPLPWRLDRISGGVAIDYQYRLQDGDQFIQQVAGDWEWGWAYDVSPADVATWLLWQQQIGRNLSNEVVWEENRHLSDVGYHQSAAGHVVAGIAVGGAGDIARRPSQQVTVAATKGTSPALLGTNVVFDQQITNDQALLSAARRQQKPVGDVAEAITFKLVETEVDMSNVALGNIVSVRLATADPGTPIQRAVRIMAIELEGSEGQPKIISQVV